MWKVLLQPCADARAQKHVADTLDKPVPVEELRRFLTAEQDVELRTVLDGRTAVPVWGVTAGKNDRSVGRWQRVSRGDSALFSAGGRIFASATVAAVFRNAALAEHLWGYDDKQQTWEYMYILDEVKSLDIPYRRFNEVAGYEPTNVIQGFEVLTPEKSRALDAAFDLHTDRYPADTTREAAEREVTDRFAGANTLDSMQYAKSRDEQAYLRKLMFDRGGRSACSMCGHLFPTDLLVASHVKRRSHCSIEEQLDFANVVAPMCMFGCDALYERGYVVVDANGVIARGRVDVEGSQTDEAIARLIGRTCSQWSATSARYYEWHQRFHTGRLLPEKKQATRR